MDLTDAIVVGHLHSAYFLAAIGFGVTVFDFIYWCFGFLRAGTTSFIAQAFGRHDMKACVAVFERGIVIALVIASVLLVLQKPIADFVRYLLHDRPTLVHYTLSYFYLRIWAAPATLMNYVFNAWFLAVKRTRYCLYLMMIINGLAIIFDVILVFGFHMNVRGVAIADVIGQWSGVVFAGCVFLNRENVREYLSKAYFSVGALQRAISFKS